MTNKIHVIAHTHWDYEWYFTSNESFIQLCYHVDEVIKALEENILDYYMLDGQMSIVEDYLEVNPEKKDRLMSLIQKGKLKVGPWYTQSDQMIIRGESLVRNLQLGIELGDSLGGADRLGYIPDAFGQSIDMPKIFSQMGIDKSVFWRGLSSDKMEQREFFWESEDGSRVVAYNIKDGYFVGVQLIESDDSESLINQIKKDTTSSHIALPVGGDQRYVDINLKERIADYNQNMAHDQFVESNYDNLFSEIVSEERELPSIQGEFLNAEVSKIHRSIYSSRYDHKYLNDKVERRLIYQVEPLMAIADRIGIPYKKELVDKIWKLNLRNHAHDSAGSCNSDKTNQAILQRLIDADQLSYSVVDYLTRKISESRAEIKENQITVFNTLPVRREQMIKLKVSLAHADFAIYHKGKKIAYEIISVEKHSNDPVRKKENPSPESYYFESEIVLPIELHAMGYEVLDIVEGEKGAGSTQTVDENPLHHIENDYYRINCVDGKLNLYNKVSNVLYENFLLVENSGDDGDNYDYSPPEKDKIICLDFSEGQVQYVQGKLESSLKISGVFTIPVNQDERNQEEYNGEVPYECCITLRQGAEGVDFQLDMENKAFDHRMRLIINGDVKADQSIADTPFGTISRPVIDPNLESWQENGWKEEPTGIYPMLNFVHLHDEQKSITAFSKGIKEYEIIGSSSKGIALTLFRAVGYLGKPDLLRRPGVASGNQFKYIETPDSQLQKKLKFKFSFVVGDTFSEAAAFTYYQNYAVSVPYYQHQSLNQFTTTLKYFVMQPLSETVPNSISLFDAAKVKDVVFSSFHKSRDGKGFVIRYFNPADKKIDDGGEMMCLKAIQFWGFTNMAETLNENDTYQSETIQLGAFKPKEIKTIYIQFS
ncbi:glycoside hydrolase family 38 C-terminal domain-containing protein [Oceanobacillus neutriphilus]|uniref:Alpha-mannosidase n=1 Tax=Oceanobacillus neutriphilus TaxID=531815 RepID=A0ABQ2NV14_9BACI|nr:glycoside hydrolase family 38 C-terminal domain-containing protein [Oceanobacillus neutriphilus]GGP11202.1 alpha-mannosidase [Oceanobacillus neutriphilus]